jgi:hypothetical protein
MNLLGSIFWRVPRSILPAAGALCCSTASVANSDPEDEPISQFLPHSRDILLTLAPIPTFSNNPSHQNGPSERRLLSCQISVRKWSARKSESHSNIFINWKNRHVSLYRGLSHFIAAIESGRRGGVLSLKSSHSSYSEDRQSRRSRIAGQPDSANARKPPRNSMKAG